MVRFAILLALLAAEPTRPELRLRAFPATSIADTAIGCSSILLTAEIRGPEVEQWYCPAVEWIIPDGTRASEESDCPPFEERTEYPRLWRRRICAPAHPTGEAWEFGVRISKRGKTIAAQTVRVFVK